MQLRLKPRAAIVALVLSVTGALGVPLVASAVYADGGPTLTASATDALRGGQTVTLSGTGHDANSTATILECSSLTGASGCDLNNIVTAPTDASGSFSDVSFTLASGAVGDGYCPGKTAGSQCYLIATTNPSDPAKTAVLPVKFSPVVTVTPSSDLENGDQVDVSGYGYPAKQQSVTVLQCANPPGASTCNLSGYTTGTTTADGTFSGVKVTVVSGAVGSEGTCDDSNPCLIVASTDVTGTDPDQSGAAVITFAATSAPTKAPTALSLAAKTKGTNVSVKGAITSADEGVAGLTVDIYQRAKGAKKWKIIASVPSRGDGSFVMKGLPHKAKAQQYQAKHAKETVGDHIYGPSASRIVTVR